MTTYDKTVVVMLGEGNEFELAKRSFFTKGKGKKRGLRHYDQHGTLKDLKDLTVDSRLYVIGHGNLTMSQEMAEKVKLNGAKETSVAVPRATTVQDYKPEELATLLHGEGLRLCKTLYLAGCNAGIGGETSYVFKFARSLRDMEGVKIEKISAPLGYVRFSAEGHKLVTAEGLFHAPNGAVKYIEPNPETALKKKHGATKVSV